MGWLNFQTISIRFTANLGHLIKRSLAPLMTNREYLPYLAVHCMSTLLLSWCALIIRLLQLRFTAQWGFHLTTTNALAPGVLYIDSLPTVQPPVKG